jgi:hypothetical protein
LLSFRFFSTLFRPVGKFWYHFGLILTPLGPQKHSIFIERVIKFQLLAIFVVEATLGHETHLKKLQMLCPSTPNGTPEEPRSAQERPGRVPKASQTPPPESTLGTLGRPKSFKGWFWESRGLILDPQGSVLPNFDYLPGASLLSSLLSSLPSSGCNNRRKGGSAA